MSIFFSLFFFYKKYCVHVYVHFDVSLSHKLHVQFYKTKEKCPLQHCVTFSKHVVVGAQVFVLVIIRRTSSEEKRRDRSGI